MATPLDPAHVSATVLGPGDGVTEIATVANGRGSAYVEIAASKNGAHTVRINSATGAALKIEGTTPYVIDLTHLYEVSKDDPRLVRSVWVTSATNATTFDVQGHN